MDWRGAMMIIGNDNRIVFGDFYEVCLTGEAAQPIAEQILALLDRASLEQCGDTAAICIRVDIDRE